jgi:hypothetical protein
MPRLKRIQVELPPEIVDVLRDISTGWRKTTNDERVGLGTVVAGLLKVLVERPETLHILQEAAERLLLYTREDHDEG